MEGFPPWNLCFTGAGFRCGRLNAEGLNAVKPFIAERLYCFLERCLCQFDFGEAPFADLDHHGTGTDLECLVADDLAVDTDGALLDHAHRI